MATNTTKKTKKPTPQHRKPYPPGKHTEQVSPFIPDPTKWARYMITQSGKEVGFVHVKGTGVKNCLELWQLYNSGAAGTGVGETLLVRAQYLFPSYRIFGTSEHTDVSARYQYRGTVSNIAPPQNMNGTHYTEIVASCS